RVNRFLLWSSCFSLAPLSSLESSWSSSSTFLLIIRPTNKRSLASFACRRGHNCVLMPTPKRAPSLRAARSRFWEQQGFTRRRFWKTSHGMHIARSSWRNGATESRRKCLNYKRQFEDIAVMNLHLQDFEGSPLAWLSRELVKRCPAAAKYP